MKASIFAAILAVALTCIDYNDCFSDQYCIGGICLDTYTNLNNYCSYSSDCSTGYYCSYGYCTKSSSTSISSFGMGISTWYFCVAGIPSIIGISLVLTIVLCVRRCALRARLLRNGGMHLATPNVMTGVTITTPQMAYARPQMQSPNIVYQQPQVQGNVGYAQPMMMQQNQPMMMQQNQPQMMMQQNQPQMMVQQNQPQMMMGQPVMQQNMGYMQPQVQVQGNVGYGQPQYNVGGKI